MHIITVAHPTCGDVIKFKISLKKSVIFILFAIVALTGVASWGTYKFTYWYDRQHNNAEILLHEHDVHEHDVEDAAASTSHPADAGKDEQRDEQLTVISEHIGRLVDSVLRLNALGEQLIVKAELDPKAFNFSEPMGIGGPLIADIEVSDILKNLSDLEVLLNKRFQQLTFLEDLFRNHHQRRSSELWGKAKLVKNGWVSSFFGRRTDPFTGKIVQHNGVDIAGREGDEVFAVASGVVSISEDRNNYGKLVEIQHSNGLATRYAHNKETLVKPGDMVKKGDAIALMGSTGRSTGPHVHLEVLQDNKAVDPGLYFSNLKPKS
ncbi:M23 family metallopeptidase [Candidatus Berkiella cookevillensis]|uniref:M23 family metallopeptidase n=1 Tax=Candidatus Berkiella cookevillensis TaxID=437022 RepID=A0A0Q9YNA7_9GAMM|nr:M23 family metallopeptidase [Candidatus Berkiella cookevillensis]MCS5709196.1 M23 family metallopeptidase [Candidatus Berkiella cookevillensis]